jgi:anti-sigma regulatory factor (Ser/Thr protein kinase)
MPAAETPVTRSGARMPSAPAGAANGTPLSLTVPGQAGQVKAARAFIAQVAAMHGLCDEIACLLGSEVVTNALQHSHSRQPGGMITITTTVTTGLVLVEVTDDGGLSEPGFREAEAEDMYAEGGRGLRLVDELSADWGYYRHGDRLVTWFEIAAQPLPALPDRTTLISDEH